jgi:hypothetical protein
MFDVVLSLLKSKINKKLNQDFMKKILLSIPAFCWIMVFTIMNGSWIQVKGETPLPVVSYQGKVIQGVVKSAVDNMPLVGVTVVEKGPQNLNSVSLDLTQKK